MAKYNKKRLMLSAFMAIVFWGLLGAMFLPLFEGDRNALEYSDRLFNSISKGSTDYIPALMEEVKALGEKPLELKLHFDDGTTEGHETVSVKGVEVAADAAKVLKGVAQASVSGADLSLSGDLGKVLGAALADSTAMFNNDAKAVQARTGMDGRKALFSWWKVLAEMDKELKQKGGVENVARAKKVDSVLKKGVEVGYNYYGIAPQKAISRAGILTFSMVFYVVYTLWWGMCIFYFFEGVGLVMTKGHKEET